MPISQIHAVASLMLFVGLTVPPDCIADEPPAKEVPVVCPAIDQDEQPRSDSFEDDVQLPIELVVEGTGSLVAEPGKDQVFEVRVDKVLYGSLPGKTVRFYHRWSLQDGPHVFALVPDVYAEKAPFGLKYELDADETLSQSALAAVRLDFYALSAKCIFVGKEQIADDENRTVEVVRTLAGSGPQAGERVRVLVNSMRMADAKPVVRRDPMIYFIRDMYAGRKPGDPIHIKPEEKTYRLKTRLPADQEAAVLDALKRADQYPIVEIKKADGVAKCREILFRGTVAETIELMGSANDATVTLAFRTLTYRREEAEGQIAAAIERDLFREEMTAPGGFRRLHHLIRLLGRFEKAKPSGHLAKLAGRYLAHMSSHPPVQPAPQRGEIAYWKDEDQEDDTCHALAWLLTEMDEREVVTTYGHTLLKLRDAANGRWKDEVQLALDTCRVEDHIELDAAVARMSGVKPLMASAVDTVAGNASAPAPETAPAPPRPSEVIKRFFPDRRKDLHLYFSSDSKTLRSIGPDNLIRLWDTATMKLLRRTPLPEGTCVGTIRPPDGRYILCPDTAAYKRSVVDENAGSPITKVFDADADRVVAQIDLPVHWANNSTEFLWLGDSEALCLDNGQWQRFDFKTGKMIQNDRDNSLFKGDAELSEDGKTLFNIFGGCKMDWLEVRAMNIVTGTESEMGKARLPRLTGNKHGLVPGGDYLYLADPGLYLFDRRTLRPALQKPFRGLDLLALTFNFDGSRFAVVTGGRIFVDRNLRPWDPGTQSMVRVHATATGKTLYAFPPSARWVNEAKFSPDGRQLALAVAGEVIEVWKLPQSEVTAPKKP